MNILIVGSGGREHVLAWKIKQSPLVKKIYCAPGNGGIAQIAECVDIPVTDIMALIKFAKDREIDLTVVGPEAPLVEGIVDAFEAQGLKVFGPSKGAAQLEGSKIFAKEFMGRCNVPTAPFRVFEVKDEVLKFLAGVKFPVVVKVDGLAAGKGVFICKDIVEAHKAVDQIMEQKVFKSAGNRILVEDCLHGEEVSILAISDGTNFCMLDSSQDHKRIFDDDLGPNTGGMGAYSPALIVDAEMLEKIRLRVIEPTIQGMKREGIPFKGVLYAGLMITLEGPMVLEFNARFGDPEAQVVLSRMKTDLVEVMLKSCEGKLEGVALEWNKGDSVCVVMSSGGYPGEYETGVEITGLKEAEEDGSAIVFHSGTKKDGNKIVTAGGRVLGVTASGQSIDEAIGRSYKAVEKIKFDHCFFRRDIGAKALRKLISR